MAQGLLGSLTPTEFFRRHWQKKPLFVRGAIPGVGAWVDRDSLIEWALRDDVESRLVTHAGRRWQVQHGPFRRAELTRLRKSAACNWTLLVQGVEQLHPQAAALLQRFSFIPHARLDDLMVSYAPAGGGVGPHFDSYDVFLLQGKGMRRWRIAAQNDKSLVANAPLRILKQFRHMREWITKCGDLLYLPPQYAHEGIALDDCMTLSVGFRAPRHQALAQSFLDFLHDELQLDGIYEDAGLRQQRHPAQISSQLLQTFSRILKNVRWNERDVRRFVGRYLTEPKPQTVFRAPRRAVNAQTFARQVAARGVRLALSTRMLFCGRDIFINGEHHPVDGAADAALIQLADTRAMPALAACASTARLLHAWYRAGYIEIA